jgi:hypothetical protein
MDTQGGILFSYTTVQGFSLGSKTPGGRANDSAKKPDAATSDTFSQFRALALQFGPKEALTSLVKEKVRRVRGSTDKPKFRPSTYIAFLQPCRNPTPTLRTQRTQVSTQKTKSNGRGSRNKGMDPRSMVVTCSQQGQHSLQCLNPQLSTSRLRQLSLVQLRQLQQWQPLRHPRKRT